MPRKRITVHFSESQQEQIVRVAAKFDLSQQDVMRIAINAGLNSMERLGPEAFSQLIEKEIERKYKR